MFSVLRATASGRTYMPIDQSAEAYPAIVDQRDWKGKGLRAGLVERITAWGGNCRTAKS